MSYNLFNSNYTCRNIIIMRKAIKTGIIGGSGYTGEELIRLISAHSEAELQAISSRDHFGKEIKQIYPNIKNLPNICFCKPEFNSFFI